MITIGTGPFRVLLWSQMHGDEPTATAALFDVFEYFQRHRTDPVVQRILSSLTLVRRPDAESRTARSAFSGATRRGSTSTATRSACRRPEGQVLKAVRDRFNPRVGFNLHNQGWSTSVGDPPKPASISLLSVAYDKPRVRERRAAS